MEQLKEGYSIQTFSGHYGEIIELKKDSVVIELEDFEKIEVPTKDVKKVIFY